MTSKSNDMSGSASHFPDKSVKPFRISRVAPFPLSGEQLASDRENAPQNHADILGCALFQARDDILATFAALADDPVYRIKLGKLKAHPFEAMAAMTTADRSVALSIAALAMNRMIEAFAVLLGAGERAIPGGYCIDYRVESRLTKIAGATADGVSLEAAGKCVIADDDEDALLQSFSRWLDKFDKTA